MGRDPPMSTPLFAGPAAEMRFLLFIRKPEKLTA
jgi:hypothetical protein